MMKKGLDGRENLPAQVYPYALKNSDEGLRTLQLQ
jgi:hypothetical protein